MWIFDFFPSIKERNILLHFILNQKAENSKLELFSFLLTLDKVLSLGYGPYNAVLLAYFVSHLRLIMPHQINKKI